MGADGALRDLFSMAFIVIENGNIITCEWVNNAGFSNHDFMLENIDVFEKVMSAELG